MSAPETPREIAERLSDAADLDERLHPQLRQIHVKAIESAIIAAEARGAEREREACIEDCLAEYRDDGTAQRIEMRIKARTP